MATPVGPPPLKKARIYCKHCDQEVSRSTWYRHYSEFYNPATGEWTEPEQPVDNDFDFGSSDDMENDDDPFPPGFELEIDDEIPFVPEHCKAIAEDPTTTTEIWDDSSDDEVTTEHPGVAVVERDNGTLKLLNLLCVFLLVWQAVFRITNSAMDVMFKFLSMFWQKGSETLKSDGLQSFFTIFPDTLSKARTMNSINRDNFQKLIVCMNCHSTYENDDFSGDVVPRCSFVRYPKHPQQRMRKKCGQLLLKTVKTSSGKKKSVPIKIFCYKSIIESIADLIQQPGNLDLFNQWKDRKTLPGVMSDIYDGIVWNSFQSYDGKEFLSRRYTLGLLLNIDWFQPYKHVSYSVGAIYISVLNFPRQLRNRRENILVVGVIPGPNEPKLHINSYLEHLVPDLLKLLRGVKMQTPEGEQLVQAALLCCASDIPASRKLGGFMGHSALKGCSRCLKTFKTDRFGQKTDYSGFDRSKWPKRTVEEHRKIGLAWKHAQTASKQHEIEQKYGVRFTELLRIPYFNTVQYIVVDPMHNIFLGTAKRMVNIWKSSELIQESEFDGIQEVVNNFITPADIGRIPYKISSQFSNFTADQWKNWTLIYSPIVLKSILPTNDYECWCIFVDACRILCSRAITIDCVEKMDSLMLRFCQKFQEIYGEELCTPNLHLHCHMKECLMDFGPAGSFWTFAYERLNGILGSVPTNHQAIETQLMKKFSTTQQVIQTLKNRDDVLMQVFKSSLTSKGSLKHEEIPELPLQSMECHLIPPIKEGCLSSSDHDLIEHTLKSCFGNRYIKTLLIHRYSRAIYHGSELYGSINSIHSNSSMVYASKTNTFQPGFVKKYLRVTTSLSSDEDASIECTNTQYLAEINWLEEHQQKRWFHDPVEVWCKYTPNSSSMENSFIPISNIKCRCAYIEQSISFSNIHQEQVIIVVPLNNFYGLD